MEAQANPDPTRSGAPSLSVPLLLSAGLLTGVPAFSAPASRCLAHLPRLPDAGTAVSASPLHTRFHGLPKSAARRAPERAAGLRPISTPPRPAVSWQPFRSRPTKLPPAAG